jgi:hypothetical protein
MKWTCRNHFAKDIITSCNEKQNSCKEGHVELVEMAVLQEDKRDQFSF